MRIIRLILVNMAMAAAIWISALVIASLGTDALRLAKAIQGEDPDARALLPVYPDRERAIRIYNDMKGAKLAYVPFVEWRRLPYTSETVNIDSDGLRTWANRGEGTIDIGFFGGSAMWGTGVEDADTRSSPGVAG